MRFGFALPQIGSLAGPEAVVPLSQLSSVSPDSGTSTVILELDGRRLATAQAPYIPGAVRRYVAR